MQSVAFVSISYLFVSAFLKAFLFFHAVDIPGQGCERVHIWSL